MEKERADAEAAAAEEAEAAEAGVPLAEWCARRKEEKRAKELAELKEAANALGFDGAAAVRLAQPQPDFYFLKEALLDSVASGAIAALRGRWYVALHKRGGRLQRRQELPAEAFWTAEELRRAAEVLGDKFGVLFVALSYRWLKQGHPGARHERKAQAAKR